MINVNPWPLLIRILWEITSLAIKQTIASPLSSDGIIHLHQSPFNLFIPCRSSRTSECIMIQYTLITLMLLMMMMASYITSSYETISIRGGTAFWPKQFWCVPRCRYGWFFIETFMISLVRCSLVARNHHGPNNTTQVLKSERVTFGFSFDDAVWYFGRTMSIICNIDIGKQTRGSPHKGENTMVTPSTM